MCLSHLPQDCSVSPCLGVQPAGALQTSDWPAHSPASQFFKGYLFVSMRVYKRTHKYLLMHVSV